MKVETTPPAATPKLPTPPNPSQTRPSLVVSTSMRVMPECWLPVAAAPVSGAVLHKRSDPVVRVGPG